MKEINYKDLLKNVDQMINLLEYDSMRSAGKCKLNSPHLDALYVLKDRYTSMLNKPVKKSKEDK